MKPTRSTACLHRHWWRALPATALVICGACSKGQQPPQQQGTVGGPRPTPAIQFPAGKKIDDVLTDAALRRDVLTQAGRLVWDTSSLAADRRFLTLHGAPGGPWGEVVPETGSAALQHDVVLHGRIVGRINLATAYADLGLPSGVTYVWVDSEVTAGDANRRWRAYEIPVDMTRPVVSRRFWARPYAGPPQLAIARWMLHQAQGPAAKKMDEYYCVPCNSVWCCPADGY